MTREEVKQVLHIIMAAYPNWKVANLQDTMDVWALMLEDENSAEIGLALKQYIKSNTSGFAPSISQVIALAKKPKEVQYDSEAEAWDMVNKALRKATYYAQEEFDKLPELAQKAIGSASQLRTWAMDEDFNESVVASNFRRSYRQVLERQKEFDGMIPEMQKLVMKTQQAMIGEK